MVDSPSRVFAKQSSYVCHLCATPLLNPCESYETVKKISVGYCTAQSRNMLESHNRSKLTGIEAAQRLIGKLEVVVGVALFYSSSSLSGGSSSSGSGSSSNSSSGSSNSSSLSLIHI